MLPTTTAILALLIVAEAVPSKKQTQEILLLDSVGKRGFAGDQDAIIVNMLERSTETTRRREILTQIFFCFC